MSQIHLLVRRCSRCSHSETNTVRHRTPVDMMSATKVSSLGTTPCTFTLTSNQSRWRQLRRFTEVDQRVEIGDAHVVEELVHSVRHRHSVVDDIATEKGLDQRGEGELLLGRQGRRTVGCLKLTRARKIQ